MIKSIIFNTPMVSAILDGRKTMTRRVIKPQPKRRLVHMRAGNRRHADKWGYLEYECGLTNADRNTFWTPPCHAEDVLWVRETWGTRSRTEGIASALYYCADGDAPAGIKWRPSIHMPRYAARIFLRVTKVSVERLQEISGEDIAREGVGKGEFFNTVGNVKFRDTLSDRAAFRELWDSLSKPFNVYKFGWDANPFVWVISFERCEKPKRGNAWDTASGTLPALVPTPNGR